MFLKNRKWIVENLAKEPEFNNLSKQMSWAFRREQNDPPALFSWWTECKTMPSRAEWEELRKEVVKARRQLKYQEKRAKQMQTEDRRREYMRAYMRAYRREHAQVR